ncbi:Rossmann-like domain-containing protein [Actinokineospora globicatena]|uniref:Putative heavy-metal chelation domain-containing protein n=1 Tax=Actinokineospora globicatena TaxID=103729 RepID=A0A9W6QNP9_9PSEU|nr:DUF364 domain-containing protein [Actinokineospora globicatena]GLW94216.1 hypothetical protein Aglo03_50320 [Actinokineospora globicatena]
MSAVVTDLVDQVRAGAFGRAATEETISVGFMTRQGVRHDTRGTGYRNHVVSLRVGRAVGSCAVEPGTVDDDLVYDCVGATVDALFDHPVLAVRVAALDAFLMAARPHEQHATDNVTIDPGTSLEKSLLRAGHVVDLLGAERGQRVLVVGVVNSLLHHLRQRGIDYRPCDLRGGTTEWGEPISNDADLTGCDAVLATGMTLGNGSFETLRAAAADAGVPLVMFAQTGSAVLPRLLGAGVTAVCAEPYPFFWLDGGPTVLHRYREAR